MEKFKGTTEDWIVDLTDEGLEEHPHFWAIKDPDGKLICLVHSDPNETSGFEKDEANLKLVHGAKELLEALVLYKKGIDHFYDCINFAKSSLDSEAVVFMNESGIAINKALQKVLG